MQNEPSTRFPALANQIGEETQCVFKGVETGSVIFADGNLNSPRNQFEHSCHTLKDRPVDGSMLQVSYVCEMIHI